ncbi:MAG: heavy-metal-associated domain-containing protein [Clostridia bacterium]
MKEIIIKVEGMMCEGCENRIKNSIKSINKIEDVKPNHKEGIVKIIAQEGLDEKLVKERIEGIGFKVID